MDEFAGHSTLGYHTGMKGDCKHSPGARLHWSSWAVGLGLLLVLGFFTELLYRIENQRLFEDDQIRLTIPVPGGAWQLGAVGVGVNALVWSISIWTDSRRSTTEWGIGPAMKS